MQKEGALVTDHQPLTKNKLLWLDDETDMVFYGKAPDSEEYERNVIDATDVRSAVEGMKGCIIQQHEEPYPCVMCKLPTHRAVLDKHSNYCMDCWVDKWFPVFAKQIKEDEES